jgi:D-alanine transaminase
MPNIAFVNGRFMPLEEATVSIEDRGYQFADGVYEVIRTYHGVPFQLEAHLQRLERSASAIALPMPYSIPQWTQHVTEALRRAGYEESKLYLQLTRGVAPRDHVFPASTTPTVVITVREMHALDAGVRARGVSAMVMEDVRWHRCDIKSTNLLANVMAKQRARDGGAYEAIFVRDGRVTEGAVSNVIAVQRGCLITANESERILSGVTRTVILSLARKAGIPVEERELSLQELRSAHEIFLTGTTLEVLAVVRLDGTIVGTGQPGELTQVLHRRFMESLG